MTMVVCCAAEGDSKDIDIGSKGGDISETVCVCVT